MDGDEPCCLQVRYNVGLASGLDKGGPPYWALEATLADARASLKDLVSARDSLQKPTATCAVKFYLS